MREYKFRGKRLDNGEWVYGYYMVHELREEHKIHYRTNHPLSRGMSTVIVDPKTVGQFTRLKDDFGKDVYGADRCEITVNDYYSNNNLTLEEGDTFRGVVKMVDYMWVVQDTDKTDIPFHNILCDEMCIEVIGTIHDKEVSNEKN